MEEFEAVLAAARYASEQGRFEYTTVDLLQGLLRTPGEPAELLTSLGAKPEHVEAFHQPADARQTGGMVRPAPTAAWVLGFARGMAAGWGVKPSPEHILLALAFDPLRTLTVVRVAPEQLLMAAGERGWTVPAERVATEAPKKRVSVVLPDVHARVIVEALAQASLANPRRFAGPNGRAKWGYGMDQSDQSLARITAESDVDLRSIVSETLRSAGLPEPPEEAWGGS